jgi:large subunit ribosomal protein L16
MMILPQNYSRKKITIIKKNSDSLAFGDFSIVAAESGRVTHEQLESLRRFFAHKFKKQAKVWLRTFSSTPITKKPEGVRLGIGKGPLKYWVCSVRAGQNLLEIKSCKNSTASLITPPAKHKLSINTFFLSKKFR